MFTGAVATLYHSEDMIDFISNYLDSPNDKLLSVLADIKCSDVLSHVSAIALASMIFAEPFWNVINSDEHYLDLYKYIMPLRDRLEHGQGKSIYLTMKLFQICMNNMKLFNRCLTRQKCFLKQLKILT